jgi:DNA end-binding protein Ku
MAPRAYWKGYLKLSLVSCPIALYPAASTSERVSFHRINKKTGNRLKQQNVDSESSEPVEKEDVGRGYEVAKGQYIPVEDEELEKIQIESTHTIEIDSFVPRDEIDERYIDSCYYIAPTDKVGQEAFAVIRDAIRDRKLVGLGRVVLTRRERVMMLEAFDKGLLATSLRYANEVREAGVYFEDIPELKLPKEMSELAGHIIDTKASHFDPKKFEDHYENALVELLRTKQAGRVIEPIRDEAPAPQRVINLMDALRASLGTEAGAGKKPPAPSAKARAGGRAAAKETTSKAARAAGAGAAAAKGTKRKTVR